MIQSAIVAADVLDRLGLEAAAGDRAAEAQVLVGVVALAWLIVHNYTAPRAALVSAFDDIFGDVLVETVRAVRRYDGRGHLSTFVGGTLRKAVRGHARSYFSRIGEGGVPRRGQLDLTRPGFRAPHDTKEILELPHEEHADDRLDVPALRERVTHILSALGEREREVVRRRFGLFGSAPETHREIAAGLGVTRQRVAQIERAAMYRIGARAEP